MNSDIMQYAYHLEGSSSIEYFKNREIYSSGILNRAHNKDFNLILKELLDQKINFCDHYLNYLV